MVLLYEEFTSKTAAKATGLTPKQVSDWANRGHIMGQSGGGIQGKNRIFSFSNVMEIAVAFEAMREFDHKPAAAFAIAQKFAHVGGEAIFVFENGKNIYEPFGDNSQRKLGLPFHYANGDTYLALTGGAAHVVLSKDGSVNLRAFPPKHSGLTAAQFLNVSEIFAQVCRNLGRDYRDELDEAYGSSTGGETE